jgi:hypothetical protein
MTHKDPNRLEDALRTALRREDPPDGFAAKVLARVAPRTVAGAEERSWFAIFSQPLIRWAAFAALSIGLIIGGLYYRNLQRERAQGEAAKQQLMLALRIAGSKLQLAKEKVQEINQPRSHPQPRPARSRS